MEGRGPTISSVWTPVNAQQLITETVGMQHCCSTYVHIIRKMLNKVLVISSVSYMYYLLFSFTENTYIHHSYIHDHQFTAIIIYIRTYTLLYCAKYCYTRGLEMPASLYTVCPCLHYIPSAMCVYIIYNLYTLCVPKTSINIYKNIHKYTYIHSSVLMA